MDVKVLAVIHDEAQRALDSLQAEFGPARRFFGEWLTKVRAGVGGNREVYRVTADGLEAGWLLVHVLGHRTAKFSALAIYETYRAGGVGKRALEEAITLMADRIDLVYAQCRVDDARAIHLVGQAGFVQVGVLKHNMEDALNNVYVHKKPSLALAVAARKAADAYNQPGEQEFLTNLNPDEGAAKIKTIGVFCGSGNQVRQVFVEHAALLGRAIANRKLRLVYGGGENGLMGILADNVVRHGGRPVGVITEELHQLGVYHKGLDELRIVKTMRERKALMFSLSDGFVALPGGYGTLEEFAEVISWAQLGLNHKPCAILNVDGYYNDLLAFLDKASAEGFARIPRGDLLIEDSDPSRLLERMEEFRPRSIDQREELKRMGPRQFF